MIETVRLTLLVVHLLGLTAIVGPFLMQSRRVQGLQFRWMLAGAIVQLASGVALVVVRRAAELPVLSDKIEVKAALAVVVLAAVVIAIIVQRRRSTRAKGGGAPRVLLYVAGLLAIVNASIAVFWR